MSTKKGADGGGGARGREPSRLPRDAQLIISLLHQMGIQDWEPRVINQLLEYTFRERPASPCSVHACGADRIAYAPPAGAAYHISYTAPPTPSACCHPARPLAQSTRSICTPG